MSTTVISAIALAIPIVLGIIGIALFSAKKNKEEEWKKSLFFMINMVNVWNGVWKVK